MSHDFDEKTQFITAVQSGTENQKQKFEAHACLVQYSGDQIGQRYVLDQASQKLGRSTECQIVLQDASVSRQHAEIIVMDGTVFLKDLASSNGTLINSIRMPVGEKVEIKDQDLINFGNIVFKFFSINNIDGFIQDKIYKLATLDGGTNIYNKRYLLEALEAQFKMSKATGRTLSIVYFDLDHFKKVNDTFGHNAGDQLLREVVSLVKTVTRKDDIFARFGGEEFVVLLPNTTKEKALEMADRIRVTIADHEFSLNYEKDGSKCTANHKQTISLGVDSSSVVTTSSAGLLESADQKLYTSKQSGRNRVTS